MSAPLSDADLLEEVLQRPREAFFPFPGLQVIRRPGWMQLVCPAFKHGGFNEVSWAVLTPETVDAVIASTLAQYRRQDLRFRWSVGPDSAPEDLGRRLEENGLIQTWVRGMALQLPALVDPVARGIEVREVNDEAGFDLFTDVMARGWGMDSAPLRQLHRVLLQQPGRRQRLFVATRDGTPAAAASYIAFPRSAYLMGGVVLREHRGKGLYRALVSARLADAEQRGISLATSHALEETSAPILERLGFKTVLRFPSYRG